MSNYRITSTTVHGDVETEEIEAHGPIEAAFLLGVDFVVKGARSMPGLILRDISGISFTDSVRENLASMVVEGL